MNKTHFLGNILTFSDWYEAKLHSIYIYSLLLQRADGCGDVHVVAVLALPVPGLLLEEHPVEVAGLRREVVLVAAPARRPLQVHHHLLQLPLDHADTGPYRQKHHQTAEKYLKISIYLKNI